MHALLLVVSFFTVANCHQHFLLYLNITPITDDPIHPTQLRLRHEEASFRILKGKPIKIYLDSYPIQWKGLIEMAQGETTEVILKPGRAKGLIQVKAFDMELSVQYHISCEPNFYGFWCTKRCIPDENGGHYICDSEGGKRCRAGWRGENCAEEVPQCSPVSPCKNNAICLEKKNGQFQCLCLKGFEGTLCERNVRTIINTKVPVHNSTSTTTPTPTTIRTVTASTTKDIVTTQPKSPSTSGFRIQTVHFVLLGIAAVLLLLILIIVGYFTHFRKTSTQHSLLLPAPPKCEVAPVPKESPPRYVPSPRKTYISFETSTPQLPRSEKPKHYVSQEDLQV